MEYSYEQLRKMTVAQLREIAKGLENDELRGYTTMHKADLLVALCQVLGLEAHETHRVVATDKGRIKSEIRGLKKQRDAALEAGERQQLKQFRRQIHALKRQLRRSQS